MRQETYDRLMDRFSVGFGLLVVWLLGTVIIFATLSLILSGLGILFGVEVASSTLIIISIISGVPISTFVLLFIKSSIKYHVSYFRDFWMTLGHLIVLEINTDDLYSQANDMEEWCKKNCNYLFGRDGHTPKRWVFLSKNDAMAFKLKWS